MNSFWLAVQFLTRLPTPATNFADAGALGRSALYYPLVGITIGLMLYLPACWFADINPWLRAALVVSLWAWLTGGLHLDGLADSSDAWVGGQGDRERSLAIMKDPCSGPAGVTSIVLLLLLKFAALGTIMSAPACIAWWLAPVAGRSILLAMLMLLPYVRANGLGNNISTHLPKILARRVLLVVCAVSLLAAGRAGLLVIAASGLLLLMLYRTLLRRLGGTTGDTLGGGVESGEALALIVLALTFGQ